MSSGQLHLMGSSPTTGDNKKEEAKASSFLLEYTAQFDIMQRLSAERCIR
jgi:hypothetical protein